MRRSLNASLISWAGGGLVLAASVISAAAEPAPSFDPNRIPGIKAKGPNFSIANPVHSDGFLRIYNVRSPYGDFSVASDAMMQVRQRELAAIIELDKINTSDAFNRALVEAGVAPIKFAGNLIINPLQTIGNTLGGIGNAMGQVGSGMANAGKSQDTPLGGLGADQKRRELAAKLGVDPYTDFEPLAHRLQKLSEAAAAGGLVVSGAMMAIPGAVGLVVSNVATGSKVADMMRDYSAAQLMDINRQKLAAMGVERPVIEQLVTNRAYTPLDMTSMVASLETINANGRADFLRRAAGVKTREAAYFNRRYAELVAEYNVKTGQITSFVSLGDFPFNQTRSGSITGVWPVDALSWTDGTAKAMGRINEAVKRGRFAGRPQLHITGQATATAKDRLRNMGWTVVENTRF
jgi:hypothetical protein